MLNKCLLCVAIVACIHLSPIAESFADSSINIWFEGNSRRVGQKETAKKSSYIWDGSIISLNAARNEFEPFQMVLRSDYKIDNVSLKISDFFSDDNVIKSNKFKIYKVEYVSAKKYGMLADPLVPLRGALSLSAGINQPVWIRLYVPATAVAGDYNGNIIISIDGVEDTIPVELHVWNFSLPEKSTLFRVSPHWESSSFVKETYGVENNYTELVYSFYKELKRIGISPAQSFDLKKVDAKGDNEIEIAFSEKDRHIDYFLNTLKYNNLDLNLYYSAVGKYDPSRSYPFTPNYRERVVSYISQTADYYREKGWLPYMWIQHYGDEPCQTCSGGEHVHPGYDFIKDWSKLSRSAASDLKILLAEQPTPQLAGSVDIWNTPWHLLKSGDVKERHEAGETVIAYSCGSKIRNPLVEERFNLWNIFSEGADGCWSWHLYYMGDFNSDDDSRRYFMFYNGKTVGITDEPVISLRSEIMGESKDDWEYLKLIEKKFGNSMASSIANIVAKRPGPLGKGNLNEIGLYSIRDFMGRKLEREKPVFQDDFSNLNFVAEMRNVKAKAEYGGSVHLDYAEPPELIEDFESLDHWKTRGPVKATLDFMKKVEGVSSVKVIFNKGSINPEALSFSMYDLPITNWSEYDFLEFDVYSEGELSLFDVNITFNEEYGKGYKIRGGIDWIKGDQVHAIGIFSENGSFPGKWRHIKMDLNSISGNFSLPEGRKRVVSLHFRMGSGGSVNEPLPDTDYVIYIDNMRISKRKYKRSGDVISMPIQVNDLTGNIEWIVDYEVPSGTSIKIQSRSGGTKKYEHAEWTEWKPIEATSLFEGKIESFSKPYFQYKVMLTSDGNETPFLRGISMYQEMSH